MRPASGAIAPVFLVGFMGAGKSTVARALAARWGWDVADTDDLVEAAERRTIEAIFAESGEGRFREAEWNALSTLEGKTRLVVATGGGLFLGVAQRALIRRSGVSCWLDAPFHVLSERVEGLGARPLWPADDALTRRAFFERRRAAYALADFRVDASADDPEVVARAIEDAKNAFWR
jgi:shikimate kinase